MRVSHQCCISSQYHSVVMHLEQSLLLFDPVIDIIERECCPSISPAQWQQKDSGLSLHTCHPNTCRVSLKSLCSLMSFSHSGLLFAGHKAYVSLVGNEIVADLFEIENACLCIGPLPEANDDQNRPQSRRPCGLFECVLAMIGQILAGSSCCQINAVGLWKVSLLVVCFMSH